MTLQQLRYVITVAQKGSISEAAKELFISQPSLSNAIKELEKEMKIIIFSRTNKGIIISDEGLEFLGYARQVLEQAELLENRYLETKSTKKRFNISTQHYSFAVNAFVDSGIPTSIHYVLSNDSIDNAIEWLENTKLVPSGIRAIIFLLYKPVGLGRTKNVLNYNDEKVQRFFKLVSEKEYRFKIGFDSCCVPAILNLSSNVDVDSIDTCEAGRFSCYITHDMQMIPCSFDNQDMRFTVNLKEHTIKEAWESEQFNRFRSCFTGSCQKCKDKMNCMGGCPLRREIVLCEREEKDLYEV